MWFKEEKGNKDTGLEAKKANLMEVGSCRQINSALPKATTDLDRQRNAINNSYLAVFCKVCHASLQTRTAVHYEKLALQSPEGGDRYRPARFMSSRSAGVCAGVLGH